MRPRFKTSRECLLCYFLLTFFGWNPCILSSSTSLSSCFIKLVHRCFSLLLVCLQWKGGRNSEQGFQSATLSSWRSTLHHLKVNFETWRCDTLISTQNQSHWIQIRILHQIYCLRLEFTFFMLKNTTILSRL